MNNNVNKHKSNTNRFKHNKKHYHNHKNNNKNNKEVNKEITPKNNEINEEVKNTSIKNTNNSTSLYTRNLDPLEVGYRLPAMTLFNPDENEFNLNDDRSVKVYVTIPTFENKNFANDAFKLETILKEYPNLNAYLISNEPVYTQKRLSKQYHYEKFRILSDFKNREFARNTGTYIYELSQLVKAIFIVDKSERILYVSYYDDLYSRFNLNEINKALKEIFE